MKPVLVTGAAGFIGFHLARRLAREGRRVIGIDNLSEQSGLALKHDRLRALGTEERVTFAKADLSDAADLEALFAANEFDLVYNLAAQAGVRYSLVNPQAYVQSNLAGFVNVLENCRLHGVGHLVYASSSAVYGAAGAAPFSTHQPADHPLSVYGASKKANELLAHSYSHLYQLPTTGLRFFTVYGPWGRPDMMMFLFVTAIRAGAPLSVFNHGRMQRDFTFIDDIVEALIRVGARPPVPDPLWRAEAPDPASAAAPYRIYNVGNHAPVSLMRVIALIEQALGKKAVANFLPMQPGDAPATYAEIADLARDFGFAPQTPIEEGVQRFVQWHLAHFPDDP